MMQFLIAVDQLINTILGGKADETMSARAHRMRVKRQAIRDQIASAGDLDDLSSVSFEFETN